MASAGIRVKTDVDRAFLQLRREVVKELRPALREIGAIVKRDAQRLAAQDIRHVGLVWQRMRVGVTAKAFYVAPAARNQGGSPRPNMGGLLLTKALEPAVDSNQEEALRQLSALVDLSIGKAGL